MQDPSYHVILKKIAQLESLKGRRMTPKKIIFTLVNICKLISGMLSVEIPEHLKSNSLGIHHLFYSFNCFLYITENKIKPTKINGISHLFAKSLSILNNLQHPIMLPYPKTLQYALTQTTSPCSLWIPFLLPGCCQSSHKTNRRTHVTEFPSRQCRPRDSLMISSSSSLKKVPYC